VAIKQYGLILGDTLYKNHFARNYVLEQLFDGVRIKPGTKIHMGSEIVLVLGDGGGGEQVPVPNLFGMTLADARVYLESMKLLDAIYPADLATNPNAYVYKQEPSPLTPDGRPNMIRQGQVIDLFLQITKPVPDTTAAPQQNDY
jgi:beta-lactam-binding protein with PASTA domain